MPAPSGWPASLSLIRHAQSAGNVANDAALASGLAELDIATRDMDVPLSDLGRRQAAALGSWFASRACPPSIVWCSPYQRAVDTATTALDHAGLSVPVRLDERLREREFGVLDRLTRVGIETRFPEQAAARAFLGKFFHRPPGGESWADVALRVRAFLTDLRLDHAGDHVVVVTHQAVIMLFRYVLDGLSEPELLAVDRAIEIANTAVGSWVADGRRMRMVSFNDADHVAPEATTDAPDVPAAPR
ncbi:MAG TPA: histidine phosphatase family protein [Acidimicrobiales bacterium]|nr:histidine phosphatase family protein [Acidimicrobiales bacterium]